MARLVCCSSCSTYILPGESACPFCGERQRSLGRAAGAVAIGLALGGCGSDDGPDADTIGTAAAYGVAETTADETVTATGSGSSSESSGSSSSSSESSTGSSGSSGSETDTDTDTDTETDTDTGGTTLEPEYGVPTTSG